MAFNLVYYSQQDPQWKNDLLGFGEQGDTIGYLGCAMTSVAMLLSGHGHIETPKTLNQKLKNVNGYVSAAIVWGAVSKIYSDVTLKAFIPCYTSDAPLAQIDASLNAGQPVIVMVDSSPAAGLQTHWVMLYARKGDDYLMLDPWPYSPGTAKEDLLMPRYSRGKSLQRAIMHVILYECLTTSGPISTPDDTQTPATGDARVKADVTWGLNIRSSMDTSSMANVVATVPAGTQLSLLDADGAAKIGAVNQWVRVRDPQGREGFCAAWYLEKISSAETPPSTEPAPGPGNESPDSPAPVVEAEKLIVLVKSAGAKIYKTDSTKSAVISNEKSGARLVVVEAADKATAKIGVAGKWLNVKATNNKRGFVDGGSVRKK